MDEFPVATSPAPGVMGVDWENRVDFERLRQYRLARVKQMLEEFDLGAVLLFETSNIRYATATQIGYWAFNKGERWALVTREGRPKVWDFGSAAKAHRLQLPHMYDDQNSVGGNTGLQGAIGPETGLHARAVREIKGHLDDLGIGQERIGLDLAETSVFLELQKSDLNIVDGQQAMMRAREIKTAEGSLTLEQEGNYVALCFVSQGFDPAALEAAGIGPEDMGPDTDPSTLPEEVQAIMANPPHLALGMLQEFTVTAAGTEAGPLPEEMTEEAA